MPKDAFLLLFWLLFRPKNKANGPEAERALMALSVARERFEAAVNLLLNASLATWSRNVLALTNRGKEHAFDSIERAATDSTLASIHSSDTPRESRPTRSAPAASTAPAAHPHQAPAARRPAESLEAFASRALAAALASKTGRFGFDKIFISHAFRALDDPQMTLDEFKARLVEAHRNRLVSLSRADLVEAMDPQDVEESETAYLSARFNFLRLPEGGPKYTEAAAPTLPPERQPVASPRAGRPTGSPSTSSGPAARPQQAPASHPPAESLEAFASRALTAAHATRTWTRGDDEKVFISHVFKTLRDPRMTLDEFKTRLVEAHSKRLVSLSRADLVEAMDPKDVEESETGHLNATWHFLRRTAPAPDQEKRSPRRADPSPGADVSNERADALVLEAVLALAAYEAPGTLLSMGQVRRAVPTLGKEPFDRAAMRLSKARKIVLHHHDFPGSLSESNRKALVVDENGVHYIGIAPAKDRSDGASGGRPGPPPPAARKGPSARGPATDQARKIVVSEMRRLEDPSLKLIRVADLVRSLSPRVPKEKIHRVLLDLQAEGVVELYPDAGTEFLKKTDADLCPPGPRGTVFSTARFL